MCRQFFVMYCNNIVNLIMHIISAKAKSYMTIFNLSLNFYKNKHGLFSCNTFVVVVVVVFNLDNIENGNKFYIKIT